MPAQSFEEVYSISWFSQALQQTSHPLYNGLARQIILLQVYCMAFHGLLVRGPSGKFLLANSLEVVQNVAIGKLMLSSDTKGERHPQSLSKQ